MKNIIKKIPWYARICIFFGWVVGLYFFAGFIGDNYGTFMRQNLYYPLGIVSLFCLSVIFLWMWVAMSFNPK